MENQNHNQHHSSKNSHQKHTNQLLIAIITTAVFTALIVGIAAKLVYGSNKTQNQSQNTLQGFAGQSANEKNFGKLINQNQPSGQNQTYEIKTDNGGKVSINYPTGWQIKNDSSNLTISSSDNKNIFTFANKALQSGNVFVTSSSSFSNGTNGYSVKTEQNGPNTTITIDNKPVEIKNPFDDRFFNDLNRINQEYDELFARMRNF